MGHDHSSHEQHTHDSKGLSLAFALNLGFTVIEIIGGFMTNSVAILSDALHDLGDSVALGLAWYFERLGQKGRDRRHSYGYRRYPLLGSMINALILVVGSVLVITEAIQRFGNPEPVNARGMILLAALGVLVNGVAFRKLHAGHSDNVKVVRLHLLEDVLGWVAVLLGAIAMLLWNIPILDPILSVLISIYILWQVLKRLRSTLRLVLQGVPSGIDIEGVRARIQQLPGVQGIHDLHVWSMDGAYHILSAHIVVLSALNPEQQTSLKKRVRELLSTMGIQHATLEIELDGEDCAMEDC